MVGTQEVIRVYLGRHREVRHFRRHVVRASVAAVVVARKIQHCMRRSWTEVWLVVLGTGNGDLEA